MDYQKNKTVAVCNMGCKVNSYEAQGMTELFQQAGYQIVEFSEKADVYLINTCTVTNITNTVILRQEPKGEIVWCALILSAVTVSSLFSHRFSFPPFFRNCKNHHPFFLRIVCFCNIQSLIRTHRSRLPQAVRSVACL